jgi:hypothetical protein
MKTHFSQLKTTVIQSFKDLKIRNVIEYLSLLALLFFSLHYLANIIFALLYPEGSMQQLRFGRIDALEYWSANQLADNNMNPYSGSEMFKLQRSILPMSEPIMMWNPPWTLSIFDPFLRIQNFNSFTQIWFIGSILAYVSSCWILIRLFINDSKIDIPLLIVILSFSPFLSALSLGQISVWPLLGFSLFLLSTRQSNPLVCWIGLVFMSIKFHLFLALAPVIALYSYKQNYLRSALILVTISPAIYIIFEPELFLTWFKITLGISAADNAIPARTWATTTLPSLIQLTSGYRIDYTILSLALIFIVALICAKTKLQRFIDLKLVVILVLLISLPLMPFAWFFDYTVIVPALIFIWSKIKSKGHLPYFLLFQLITLVFFTRFMHSYTEGLAIIVPLSAYILYMIKDEINQRTEREAASIF